MNARYLFGSRARFLSRLLIERDFEMVDTCDASDLNVGLGRTHENQ